MLKRNLFKFYALLKISMQRKKIKFHNRTKKKMFIDICVIFRIETSCSALGWKRSFKRWKRSQKLLDYWIDLSV